MRVVDSLQTEKRHLHASPDDQQALSSLLEKVKHNISERLSELASQREKGTDQRPAPKR